MTTRDHDVLEERPALVAKTIGTPDGGSNDDNGGDRTRNNGIDYYTDVDDINDQPLLVSPRTTSSRPSNEYVLNVAFLSFLIFTTVQFFFATLAHSDAMMTDCAAMMVDVVTYLFNFLAERLKHPDSATTAFAFAAADGVGQAQSLLEGENGMAQGQQLLAATRKVRLHRLYLELIPPLISVATLMAVTVSALRVAIGTLLRHGSEQDPTAEQEPPPDLFLMLLFSSLNLLLDALNVGCFARVDQAVGLSEMVTKTNPLPTNHHHNPHHHHHYRDIPLGNAENDMDDTMVVVVTEVTPLLRIHDERNAMTGTSGDVSQPPPAPPHTTPYYYYNNYQDDTSTGGGGVSVGSSDNDDNNDDNDDDDDSTDATGRYNLNMCSAWTHVFADTLRSIAVLIAAILASIVPHVLTASQADSDAAIVVSIVILISLVPLMQGLYLTACKIYSMYHGPHECHHAAAHHDHNDDDVTNKLDV